MMNIEKININKALNYRKKILIRFLKENNCYENFKYNISNLYGYRNYKTLNFSSVVRDYYKHNTIDEIISFSINTRLRNFETFSEIFLAFFWFDSEEGERYWKEINNKWIKVIGNDNYYNLLEIQIRL